MSRLVKFSRLPLLIGFELCLLVGIRLSLYALVTQSAPVTASPSATTILVPPTESRVFFSDEFVGSELDQSKWDVFTGTPTVNGGWLMLPGADLQSKPVFSCGNLEAVVRSSDWKPHSQFTDSSFGFEIWTGSDGVCHYGAVFKANGHLGLLRSEPVTNSQCMNQSLGITGRHPNDPKYQDFLPIQNWKAIRSSGTLNIYA